MTLTQVTITAGDRDPITLNADEWARVSARTGITYPDAEAFKDVEFIEAESIAQLAGILIEEYDEFAHVRGLSIAYLWKAEGGKVDGALKTSECKRTSGLLKHYSDADFVIWLAADNCLKRGYGPYELEAELHEALCHIDLDDKGKPSIRKPDFSGYSDNARRYRLWNRELTLASEAVKQLTLDGVAA